ncbi:MAG: alpha/beta hydrolase [Ilumatobacteraceae bacterium]
MRRACSMIWCAVLLASCAAGPAVRATDAAHSDATFDPTSDPFGWTKADDAGRVEIGTFTVPMDYTDPSKGTFKLNIARHLAMKPSERIGSLLINPGGPGAAGTDFALLAEQNFGKDLLDHFDIVAWDPRGTGQTTPHIDCTDNYDHFFATSDITPDTPVERQQLVDLAKEFASDCVDKNGAFYQYVGTNNSARDMDAIRAALGEPKISYLGFSYGSELGATWATLFPATVRAAVLDGAVDPTANQETRALEQDKGFEDSLTTFLDQCSADSGCAFYNGGDAAGAFDRLMAAIDASPIPSSNGRPAVSLEVAIAGVGQAMYSDTDWPVLANALAAAQKGDGRGLLSLYDAYYERRKDGSYDNFLEAFQVITCMDSTERPTVEQDDATVPQFKAVAPRFYASTVGSYFCTFFPPAKDPRIQLTGKGAGPIVVVGTTGDPATPLDGARKMAATLEDGHLVVVVGNHHTGYLVNACATAAVDDYLIDPAGHLPAEGLRCQ